MVMNLFLPNKTAIIGVKIITQDCWKKPESSRMPNATERPHMTIGRAMVLKLLKQYCVLGYELTFLEIQKLLYFLQESGRPLKLNFEKYHYGPYADNVRHVLSRFEGHFTVGFGEGRSNPQTPIKILPQALDEMINKVQSWNQHKKNTMKPAHILVTMERLTQEEWI